MDINEYMQESMEHRRRQTALLEAIAEGVNALGEGGGVNLVLPEGTEVRAVGDVVRATPVEKVAEKAPAAKVVEKAPAAKADKPKKVTVDDARAALKDFAKAEGNDAAMELLSSMGATSITALAESGPDKLAELIAKCKGGEA